MQPLPGDIFDGYSWGDKSPFRGRRTVEGLASSVALTERLEMMTREKNLSRSCLVDLEDDHVVWDHAANALANLCVTLILTTSIEKIVLGGGIMQRNGLLKKIQRQTVILLNKYLELPQDMSELITTSSYGNDIGLIGAMVLAQRAYEKVVENPSFENKQSKISPFSMGVIHGLAIGVGAASIGILLARRTR